MQLTFFQLTRRLIYCNLLCFFILDPVRRLTNQGLQWKMRRKIGKNKSFAAFIWNPADSKPDVIWVDKSRPVKNTVHSNGRQQCHWLLLTKVELFDILCNRIYNWMLRIFTNDSFNGTKWLTSTMRRRLFWLKRTRSWPTRPEPENTPSQDVTRKADMRQAISRELSRISCR